MKKEVYYWSPFLGRVATIRSVVNSMIGLKRFKSLTRWYEEISKREAVQKGYDLLKRGDKIPKV